MLLKITLINFIGVFYSVLSQDDLFFDDSEWTRSETTNRPTKFIDIYTNHNNYNDVIKTFNFRTKRPNHRYLEEPLPESTNIRDRNDYNYYNIRNNKKDVDLQSEFGIIVTDGKPPDPITYVPPETTTEKFEYNQDRRPRFKTQRYNWTNNFNNRFSYIQKIPKLKEQENNFNTKSKINDMLKKYLTKLYAQKYQHFNYTKPIRVYEDDDLKSKFFDETLWNLKNKTKTLANKLFSLFTVVQFANSKCTTSSTSGEYEGTCYTPQECTNMNGVAMGNCANGYGVCCVFRGTCGGSSNQNCSYFESPGYPNYYPSDNGVIVPTTEPPDTTMNPSPTPDPRLRLFYRSNQFGRQSNDALTCVFNVLKLNDNIQQMRIEFIDLDLSGPTDGTCINERLVISGQNINSQIPAICGYNSGQQVYVDVSMLTGPLMIQVLSTAVANKRFKIRICQLSTSCTNSNNCLQYYTGVTGEISSFNYNQAAMFNRSSPGYFNNLNYAICIRKEAGYCSITYTNVRNGVEYPFQFRNVDDNGVSIIPPGQAGADIFNCPNDYIVIDGTRLCGDKFNDGSVIEDFTMNAPVTDTSAGPIVIPVRTDDSVTGQGFRLFYTQNRCT